jgi:hypothetical protein
MHRLLRTAVLCVALSVVFFPAILVLALPHLPHTVLGWLALVFLPIPLAVFGEWLFEYRSSKLLAPLDSWASKYSESPLHLVVFIGLLVVAGGAGLVLLSLLG